MFELPKKHTNEKVVSLHKNQKKQNKSVGKFRPIRQSRENPPGAGEGGIRFPLTTVGRNERRRRRRRYIERPFRSWLTN